MGDHPDPPPNGEKSVEQMLEEMQRLSEAYAELARAIEKVLKPR